MPILQHQKPLNSTYYPSKLKTSSNRWRIEYYVLNPLTNKMERFTHRVDKIKKKYPNLRIAKKELEGHCEAINLRLLSGWTPFEDISNSQLIRINDAIELYISSRFTELREESRRSYRSYLKIFKEWLYSVNKLNTFTTELKNTDTVRYMDYLTVIKRVGPATWNGYRSFMITFFDWLIERGYNSKNHFKLLKPKRKTQKKRIIISASDRKKIFEYLEQYDYTFLMFILFEYYCLMRPIEICRLKIGNIYLSKQQIYLYGDQTKNKYNRVITIPDKFKEILEKYFETIKINNYNHESYLFSRKFKPGNFLIRTKGSGAKWIDLRRRLNFPKEYQLYSLRDTAITEMLMNKLSAKVVQNHADHHDITITSTYANHVTPEIAIEIKENYPCNLTSTTPAKLKSNYTIC